MKKSVWLAFFFLFAFLWYVKNSFADAKTYVWTREYKTLPQGVFEFEDSTTLVVPNGGKTNENSFEYQGELEYGVTDHWTFAHYQRWQTINVVGSDDSTVYKGFKFETKYRIGEKGKYWLNPLLYVEWATDPRDHKNPNAIESKLILSKDFGKLNITYNQIMDSKLGRGGRTEHEFSVGSNYEIFSSIRVGAEFAGQYWAPGTHRNELSVGPTIAYEHEYFWVALGTLFAVNHAADDHQVRLIVGLPLPFDTPSFFKKVSSETPKAV